MEMIKSPHPYRKNGFYLTFPNGHVWSCVNLGKNDFLNEKISDNFNDEINKIFERIGRFYDTSSGRYEAMIVTKNGVDDNHQIREHSFEKLFKAVKQYEKDNFKL